MNDILQTRPDNAASWLSPDEIALVRRQFARIDQDADAFAVVFYDALFSVSPLVRAMFRGEMPEQRAKLMQMLTMLVSNLHESESLAETLQDLGLRHRGYGVLALDYDCMGEALENALGDYLGAEEFDEPARSAWSKVYVFIASNMQSARE